MKKYYLLLLFVLGFAAFGQQRGISYQAVIINPNNITAPGYNGTSNPLANKSICLSFQIVNSANQVEYQESQAITTDAYGMVNLVIGNGTSGAGLVSKLDAVNWNQGNKKLVVAVNTDGVCSNYTEISNQVLNYTPYSFYAQNADLKDGYVTDVKVAMGINPAKVGLGNVNNTSDVNKPLSTATQTALNLKANSADVSTTVALKENLSNKSSDIVTDGTSTIKYPTVKAIKDYVDAQNAAAGVADGSITSAKITNGTIVNEDVAATAAIGFSKLNIQKSDVVGLGLSKADIGLATVDNTSDANKPVSIAAQTALDLKANSADFTTSLALKANLASPTFTGTVSGIDKTMVGLNNIDNTTDANKPVSTATQTALDLKANSADVTTSLALKANLASPTFTGTVSGIDKTMVGLNNVDNTSDVNKPVSTATQTVLDLKANSTDVTTSLALKADLASPTFTGTVSGITSTMVGLANVTNTSDADKPVSTATQTALDFKATLASPTFTGTVSGITSTMVGLGNVTNTSDADKPVSTAGQTALDLKANLASPTFTGTVAIGTANPSSAAVLDITSTSKGLLLPRLTFVQKSAIISPEAGLILWCSNCGTNGELQVYNGTNFVNMVGANAQFALPTVSATSAATAITSSALTSGGSIDSDGGALTERGVVWNTSTNPTTSLSTKTSDGTGIGTFSSSLTGLNSGVTYYVRAYATNSVGTIYGPEITVNTPQAVATLATTTAASPIGATTATSGGNITYNGGATVTVSGLVWSTITTPTIALSTKTTDGTANGIYSSSITGLTVGTLYYVRSYATNSVGTSYGAQTSFTTLNTATVSSTAPATSITSSTATSGGTITSDGGADITARGLVWDTSIDPVISLSTKTTDATGTGTYTTSITGLSPATVYYYRSYATNSMGTVYGPQAAFTTNAIAPTLTTTAASSITKNDASSGGTITSNGGSPITTSGICWSTTATPTISDSKTTNGLSSGTYASTLIGLTAGTTYYVRAFATNAIGTSYGAAQSFTTKEADKIVGQLYGGGAIFYILKNGDPGYDANIQHGLILAPIGLGFMNWNTDNRATGATGTALGTGASNTNAIIASQGGALTNSAAGKARAYNGGGYTDWYLGSLEEIRKLNNIWMVNGLPNGYNYYEHPNAYWTSTESSTNNAQAIRKNIGSNDQYYETKNSQSWSVTAIRSF